MKKMISVIVTILVLAFLVVSHLPKQTFNQLGVPFSHAHNNKKVNVSSDADLLKLKWNENDYPAYYAKLNTKDLTHQDQTIINNLNKKHNINTFKYDGLDQEGRSGNAYGLVTYESVKHHSSSEMQRPSFDSDADPSGWPDHNPKMQTGDYRGYLYNRSHSIAWSLGGSMNRENLTTGTRTQNVGTRGHEGGMAYLENKVRDAVYSNHSLRVYYKVRPIYKEQESLPHGSEVTAYSISDHGQTLNERVYVFNAQKGVNINYVNGQASGKYLQ